METILKFYSPLCGPCKVLEKNLQEAGVKYDSVNVFEDENNLADKYDIRSIPTLVKLSPSGELIAKYTGVMTVEQIKIFCND